MPHARDSASIPIAGVCTSSPLVSDAEAISVGVNALAGPASHGGDSAARPVVISSSDHPATADRPIDTIALRGPGPIPPLHALGRLIGDTFFGRAAPYSIRIPMKYRPCCDAQWRRLH